MPDITSLLERTTPDDLRPLDLDALARRSRQRRARRGALLASTTVVTVAAQALRRCPLSGSDSDRRDVSMPAIGPDGRPLTEPAGSWSRADDPPFSPRMDAIGGTLSDGRVVVWGGRADDGDTAEDNDDVNERVVAVTSTACRTCSQQRPGSQSDDRPLPPGAGLPSAPGE